MSLTFTKGNPVELGLGIAWLRETWADNRVLIIGLGFAVARLTFDSKKGRE